jgi:hypothetical protein
MEAAAAAVPAVDQEMPDAVAAADAAAAAADGGGGDDAMQEYYSLVGSAVRDLGACLLTGELGAQPQPDSQLVGQWN